MKTNLRIAALSTFMVLYLALSVVPASADNLYNNGPANGQEDGWAINFGFSVSDSFTVPAGSNIQSLEYVYWDASSTDLLTTTDIQIGATPFGGTAHALTGVTNTFLGTNQYGYNLYEASYSFSGVPWAGAGWLSLSNACTVSGCSGETPIYWDENSGPSSAMENTLGTIPSESFTLAGSYGGGSTPEPSSLMLLGSGILGLATFVRRRLLDD
jgi:PEP-CTERM motif